MAAITRWPRAFFRDTIAHAVEALLALNPPPHERILRLLDMTPRIGAAWRSTTTLEDDSLSFSSDICPPPSSFHLLVAIFSGRCCWSIYVSAMRGSTGSGRLFPPLSWTGLSLSLSLCLSLCLSVSLSLCLSLSLSLSLLSGLFSKVHISFRLSGNFSSNADIILCDTRSTLAWEHHFRPPSRNSRHSSQSEIDWVRRYTQSPHLSLYIPIPFIAHLPYSTDGCHCVHSFIPIVSSWNLIRSMLRILRLQRKLLLRVCEPIGEVGRVPATTAR